VSFCAQSSDVETLAWLVDRKRAQYAATGARDHFAPADRRALLSLLLDAHEPGCAGMLSTLHFGDTLVAAHFGIRSEQVLHWWFPVYDPDFACFSPGWIMLRELMMCAPSLGLARIDLGRGDDEYKRRARTEAVEVAAGLVTASAVRKAGRQMRSATVTAAKASPLAPALRRAVHGLRTRRIRERPETGAGH
jgi:CelD/BcsL family acetyltransferase involved in cellulose biosynthesis